MEITGLEFFVVVVSVVVGICSFIPPDKPEPPKGNGTFIE